MTDPRKKTGAAALDFSLFAGMGLAVVYVAGWSYAYHWFERFGLGLVPLDISREFFLLYGFWTLRTYWWVLLILAVTFASQPYWWDLIKPTWKPILSRTFAVVLVVLLFFVAYRLGEGNAQRDFDRNKADGFHASNSRPPEKVRNGSNLQ